MAFRFLEHTADVQVECSASTFSELLETGAEALYAIALKTRRGDVDEVFEIDVSADGVEEIFVRWLHELIFLLETEGLVGVDFAFASADPEAVRARVSGYRCSPEERAEEVKSATYHDLAVEHRSTEWVARIILDL